MIQGGIDLHPDEIIRRIENIFSILSENKFTINTNSRFHSFYRNFKDLYQTNNIKDNFQLLLEGMRDFFEISSIFSSSIIINEARIEIVRLFEGNALPSIDTNPLARNLQYQLHLASLFEHMDIKCVEPDFTFVFEGKVYSVAAKRITSKSKLFERIKEAEKQILNQEHDGFIAISLDRLIELENPFIHTDNPDLLPEATLEIIMQTMRNLFGSHPEIFQNRNKRIRGFIITLGIPSFTPKDISFGYGFNLQLFPLSDDEDEFQRIGQITNKLFRDG